jgi:hypothetical protein
VIDLCVVFDQRPQSGVILLLCAGWLVFFGPWFWQVGFLLVLFLSPVALGGGFGPSVLPNGLCQAIVELVLFPLNDLGAIFVYGRQCRSLRLTKMTKYIAEQIVKRLHEALAA